jgi:hypothetical protein
MSGAAGTVQVKHNNLYSLEFANPTLFTVDNYMKIHVDNSQK